MKHPDQALIERLGGSAEVAKLCDCSSQAVSQWKVRGIPKARRQFLRLARPEAFQGGLPHLVAAAANDVEVPRAA